MPDLTGSNRAPREQGFFDGIDTTLPGLFAALGRPAPAGAVEKLREADAAVGQAMSAFTLADPTAVAPPLARGLAAVRDAIVASGAEPDAVFLQDHGNPVALRNIWVLEKK